MLRYTRHHFPFAFLLVASLALLLFSCVREQKTFPTEAASPPSKEVSEISIQRGITGLELGMTPQQIGQLFTIKEDQDPVAQLLKKYGKPAEGEVVSRKNATMQKRFFRVSSGVRKLPDGVTSADVRVTHNIAYEIGLHFDEASIKKIGWEGVTYPYVAKYGKPSEETGSGYTWKDARTRLDVEAADSLVSRLVYGSDRDGRSRLPSGPSRKPGPINVFFTDEALEIEMKKEESTNQ